MSALVARPDGLERPVPGLRHRLLRPLAGEVVEQTGGESAAGVGWAGPALQERPDLLERPGDGSALAGRLVGLPPPGSHAGGGDLLAVACERIEDLDPLVVGRGGFASLGLRLRFLLHFQLLHSPTCSVASELRVVFAGSPDGPARRAMNLLRHGRGRHSWPPHVLVGDQAPAHRAEPLRRVFPPLGPPLEGPVARPGTHDLPAECRRRRSPP